MSPGDRRAGRWAESGGTDRLGHEPANAAGRSSAGRLGALAMVGLATVLLSMIAACSGPSASSTPPGVALPGGLAVGSSVHSLAVDGRTRTFRVYRPATVPAGARVPLVVMIHGGGGNAQSAESRYGWDPEADRGGFLVAYPEGVERSWNGGQNGCCGGAGAAGVDDVGFLSGMISSIEATVPVDPARVYSTGISEGGIMSYRLACSTHVLAAIGPDSATLLGPCPAPDPISVIHIHGSADTRIPFDGRPGAGVNHITGGPITAVVDRWRAVDRCPPPAVSSAGVVHTATSACPEGRTVTLVTIDGAGHQWPGSAAPPSDADRRIPADPPSPALNATDTIWTFFAAHQRV